MNHIGCPSLVVPRSAWWNMFLKNLKLGAGWCRISMAPIFFRHSCKQRIKSLVHWWQVFRGTYFFDDESLLHEHNLKAPIMILMWDQSGKTYKGRGHLAMCKAFIIGECKQISIDLIVRHSILLHCPLFPAVHCIFTVIRGHAWHTVTTMLCKFIIVVSQHFAELSCAIQEHLPSSPLFVCPHGNVAWRFKATTLGKEICSLRVCPFSLYVSDLISYRCSGCCICGGCYRVTSIVTHHSRAHLSQSRLEQAWLSSLHCSPEPWQEPACQLLQAVALSCLMIWHTLWRPQPDWQPAGLSACIQRPWPTSQWPPGQLVQESAVPQLTLKLSLQEGGIITWPLQSAPHLKSISDWESSCTEPLTVSIVELHRGHVCSWCGPSHKRRQPFWLAIYLWFFKGWNVAATYWYDVSIFSYRRGPLLWKHCSYLKPFKHIFRAS